MFNHSMLFQYFNISNLSASLSRQLLNSNFLPIIAAILVTGCASALPAKDKNLRYAEALIGTNREEIEWNFHSLLEYKSNDNDIPRSSSNENSSDTSPNYCGFELIQKNNDQCGQIVNLRGIGLQFPGYILGIEKTDRETLGLEEGPFSSCNETVTRTLFEQSFLKAPLLEAGRIDSSCFIKRRLDDSKRTFLSHIAVFRNDSCGAIQRISGSLLYDVYSRTDLLCTLQSAKIKGNPIPYDKGVFRAGYEDGLKSLEVSLEHDLAKAKAQGAPFTHLFVYVMGWNTGQSESIENFNNLFGYLLDASIEEDKFKPLFIGVSWPSAWSFGTSAWDNIVRGTSFFNKKNDADEVGATWLNYLVNQVITGIKQKTPSLRVVLVGHSFGARVASRALYSCDLLPHPEFCRNTIDLVVGLQPAFGRSRFGKDIAPTWQEHILVHPMHHEGLPFTDYSNFGQFSAQQVYVWSRYDSATTRTAMMGGSNAVEQTWEKSGVFLHLPDEKYIDAEVGYTKKLINFIKIHQPDLIKKRVLLLDGSGFVRNDTPYHGGGAHSDVYNREIGELTWELVKKFAPLN